jgi:pimeloyl-ACP methyl ester carboxylesterase
MTAPGTGVALARKCGSGRFCIVAVSTSPARLDGLPALPGVEHHWIDVRSDSGPVRLHMAAIGSGTPVLLLHGWPQHWWCWRRVVRQLSGHYRLLVPDLRGFGWSEAPGSGYSPTAFADDAVALLDALDLARVHVIGHDWGGFSGFLLGLHHAERVNRLLLCNSPGPWARLNPRVAIGLRRAWYAGLVATPILGDQVVAHPGFIPWFLRLGGQVALFPDADAAVYADQFRDRARTAASSQLYRSYLRLAQAILLRRAFEGQWLQAPTRLLFGADDFYIPVAVVEEIEAHGADLTLEVVYGCSHWMPEERPDLIADRARALFG